MKKHLLTLIVSLMFCVSFALAASPAAKPAKAEITNLGKMLAYIDETSEEIHYDGVWDDVEKSGYINSGYRRTQSTKNESAGFTVTVEGTKAHILGDASKNGNISLAVSVDGNDAQTVSVKPTTNGAAYGATHVVWTGDLGDNTAHTISVTVTYVKDEETAASKAVAFWFDGLYVVKDANDSGAELVPYSDPSFQCDGLGDTGSVKFCDNNGDGKQVIASISKANLIKAELMSSKKADSARITVSVNGEEAETLDLASSEMLSNTSVWTMPDKYYDPLDAQGTVEIVITVVNDSNSRYFEFYGFRLTHYFNPADYDKGDYVLDETPVDPTLLHTDRAYGAANLETTMQQENGVLVGNTGDTATFMFLGSALEIIADKRPDGGKAEISVDGNPANLVNFYSEQAEDDAVVYRVPALEGYLGREYIHTVTVRVSDKKSYYSSGNTVRIKCFRIYHKEGADVDNVDYDQYDWKGEDFSAPEGSSFVALTDAAVTTPDFGGNFADPNGYFTDKVGGYLVINFRGTGIKAYGAKGPDKGKADVYLDGILQGRFTSYSATPAAEQLLFSVKDLTCANHTIVMEIVSERSLNAIGGYVTMTSAQVLTVDKDVDRSAIIENDDAYLTQEGFGTSEDSRYHGGTALFSNNMSDSTIITMRFRGTSLRIFATRGSDQGIATVTVDGTEYYANCRSNTSLRIYSTPVIEITGLDGSTNHTLTIHIDGELNPVGANAYITIDCFDIENYAEPVFEGYLEPDDEHKDVGKDPELGWREDVDEEFEAVTPAATQGCTAGLGGTGLAFLSMFVPALILKKKKD